MSESRERHLGGKNAKKGLLFAIEDTGYAFDFYMTYLKTNYSGVIGDLLGVGGADSFDKALSQRYNYDKYIIIYDSGAEMKKLNKIGRALTNLRKNTDAPIYLFTPKCFEEVLLSFTLLQDYVRENKNTKAYKVYRDVQEMMLGSNCVNYFQYDSEKIMSEEKKIEQYIEELTSNTVFEYKHTSKKHPAVMSECWIRQCCQIDKTNKKYTGIKDKMESCRGFDLSNTTKTELIAENSLLAVLDNYLRESIKQSNNTNLAKLNPVKKKELWRKV